MAEVVFNSLNFWHLRGNMKVTNFSIFEKRHYLKTTQRFQVNYQPGAWESNSFLLIPLAKLIWLNSSGQQCLHMAITWYLARDYISFSPFTLSWIEPTFNKNHQWPLGLPSRLATQPVSPCSQLQLSGMCVNGICTKHKCSNFRRETGTLLCLKTWNNCGSIFAVARTPTQSVTKY